MKKNPYVTFGTLSAVLVFVLSAGLLFNFELPSWLAIVVATNIVSVFLVGLDKSLSRGTSLRVPEAVLFVLALCGGSLGVFVAMQIFRHKTQKAAFHFVLLLVFFAQILLYRMVTTEHADREQDAAIHQVIV